MAGGADGVNVASDFQRFSVGDWVWHEFEGRFQIVEVLHLDDLCGWMYSPDGVNFTSQDSLSRDVPE